MKLFENRRAGVAALLAGWLAAGCSDSQDVAGQAEAMKQATASELLAYVPDSTPYVVANTHRADESVINLLWHLIEPGLGNAETQITEGLKRLQAKTDKTQGERLSEAVISELSGKLSRAGMAELGLDSAGDMAFYGIGMMPVMRVTVSDAGRLRATIERIEQKAGRSFPRYELGGIEYYQGGDDKALFIASIQEDVLVLGIVPAEFSDSLLPQVLGLEKPSHSLADSGRLARVNAEFGLLPLGTLVVDGGRLVDAIFRDDSEAAMSLYAEQRALEPACEAEFRRLAGAMPRVVGGTTKLNEASIEQLMVAELRSDLAQGLSALKAVIPGLGLEEDGMFYLSMGLNLIQAKQFVADRAAATVAQPYQCSRLLDLNDKARTTQQQVGQPLPPFVGNLRGLRVNAATIEVNGAGIGSPQFHGQAMLAMDNPQLMLGMAQALVPQLAELQLGLDGEPVELPGDISPVDLDATYVAMVESGIGFSMGEGQQVGLRDFVTADVAANPPFMAFGYDTAAIESYQKALMAELYPDADQPAYTGLESIERILGELDFTPRGIELRSTTRLKPAQR